MKQSHFNVIRRQINLANKTRNILFCHKFNDRPIKYEFSNIFSCIYLTNHYVETITVMTLSLLGRLEIGYVSLEVKLEI